MRVRAGDADDCRFEPFGRPDFRRVDGIQKLHVAVETLEHHQEHALFCVLIGTETSWCDGFTASGASRYKPISRRFRPMKWLASAQLCHASVMSPPAIDITAASVLVISVSSGFDFTITSTAGRLANSSRNGATPMNLPGFAACTIADKVPLTALPVRVAAVTSTCVSPVCSRRSSVKNSAVRSDSVNE